MPLLLRLTEEMYPCAEQEFWNCMANHRAYPPSSFYSGSVIHIPTVLLKSLCQQPGSFLNEWWIRSGYILRTVSYPPSGSTNCPCSNSCKHCYNFMARFLSMSFLLIYDSSASMCYDKSLLFFAPPSVLCCHLP